MHFLLTNPPIIVQWQLTRQKIIPGETNRTSSWIQGSKEKTLGQFEGGSILLKQLINALPRAGMVAALIALPAIVLPSASQENLYGVVIFALVFSLFIFFEYYSLFPSIIEFRFAPPVNRLRFGTLVLIVVLITAFYTDDLQTGIVHSFAGVFDQPFLPLGLASNAYTADIPPGFKVFFHDAAGLSYGLSLVSVAVFLLVVCVGSWPKRSSTFNLWVNMPLFSPTTGANVVTRLSMLGNFNILIGLVLPYLLPMLGTLAPRTFNPIMMQQEPYILVWVVALWAMLPAGLVIRGIAMLRVAKLIRDMRKCPEPRDQNNLEFNHAS